MAGVDCYAIMLQLLYLLNEKHNMLLAGKKSSHIRLRCVSGVDICSA